MPFKVIISKQVLKSITNLVANTMLAARTPLSVARYILTEIYLIHMSVLSVRGEQKVNNLIG
jgi:hypothetical protein